MDIETICMEVFMYDEECEAMVGMEVEAWALSDDSETLTLFLKNGKQVVLEVDAYCCSSTWIESLDTPEYLIGTIQQVENLEMPDLGHQGTPKHPDVDCVAYYGLKITTDKGSCVIDYRNDSNGYYGGDLCLKSVK